MIRDDRNAIVHRINPATRARKHCHPARAVPVHHVEIRFTDAERGKLRVGVGDDDGERLRELRYGLTVARARVECETSQYI